MDVNTGEPVTLVITRATENLRQDIVIDEDRIKQAPPLNTPVKVTFTPKSQAS